MNKTTTLTCLLALGLTTSACDDGEGGQDWEDCGRVGNHRTRGVFALVVHDGALYAATVALILTAQVPFTFVFPLIVDRRILVLVLVIV